MFTDVLPEYKDLLYPKFVDYDKTLELIKKSIRDKNKVIVIDSLTGYQPEEKKCGK